MEVVVQEGSSGTSSIDINNKIAVLIGGDVSLDNLTTNLDDVSSEWLPGMLVLLKIVVNILILVVTSIFISISLVSEGFFANNLFVVHVVEVLVHIVEETSSGMGVVMRHLQNEVCSMLLTRRLEVIVQMHIMLMDQATVNIEIAKSTVDRVGIREIKGMHSEGALLWSTIRLSMSANPHTIGLMGSVLFVCQLSNGLINILGVWFIVWVFYASFNFSNGLVSKFICDFSLFRNFFKMARANEF
jgi:hypothetical protein